MKSKEVVMKRSLALAALLICLILPPVMATEVDTVQIGLDKAYLHSDGSLSIPIYLSNANPVNGIGWPILVATSGQPLLPDSIGIAGRIKRPLPIGILSLGNVYPPVPQQTDTICMLMATNAKCIEAGSGIAGAAWFTGAALGDQIQISVFGNGDSLSGSCYTLVHVVGCNGNTLENRLGVFIPSNLTVVPAAVEIVSPDTVLAQTAMPVSIPISIGGFGNSFSLSIVSLTGPSSFGLSPTLSGNNPFQIVWTPPLHFSGDYSLTVRARDVTGQTLDKVIAIRVAASAIQGDTNCDGVVDLVDLARLVAYLTGAGSVPVCTGKTQ